MYFYSFPDALVLGALLTYAAAVVLMMSFCSPYWIESYEESFSNFKNMGLWEYCFKDFSYPYYQFTKLFNGCHNIFSHVSLLKSKRQIKSNWFFIKYFCYFLQEYYVIREWLVPGWLMAVQAFVTISFILTFFSLGVMALELIRWPLKIVLQYEWIMTRVCYICTAISSKFLPGFIHQSKNLSMFFCLKVFLYFWPFVFSVEMHIDVTG